MVGALKRGRGAKRMRPGPSAELSGEVSPAASRRSAREALAALIVIEGLWAFSFYAVQTSLTLYMMMGPADLGGLELWRGGLQAVFGPLSAIGLASATYGLFSAAAYALPMAGGFLGDRRLGRRPTLAAGLSILAVSHLAFASPAGFLPGLIGMAVGVGLLKPNMVAQIGEASEAAGVPRARSFGAYFISANIGALSAPLICGSLVESGRWALGYAIAGFAMLMALVVYGWSWRRQDQAPKARCIGAAAKREATPWRLALLGALLTEIFFFAAYNQAFNVFPVWARAHMDRWIGGLEMPVTWFDTLDGIFSIGATLLALRLWRLSTFAPPGRRILVGVALGATGFLILAAAASTAKAPLAGGVIFFLLVDAALPWIDVTVLAQLTASVPRGMAGRVSGLYFLSTAAAALLAGALGGLYGPQGAAFFWLVQASVLAVAAVGGLLVTVALGRPKSADIVRVLA